jgi:hypothetical protein
MRQSKAAERSFSIILGAFGGFSVVFAGFLSRCNGWLTKKLRKESVGWWSKASRRPILKTNQGAGL